MPIATPRAMFRILSVTCLLTHKALRLIASEASLLHELAGAFLWYIYIYIYLYHTTYLVPRGPPVTRNAQTSDRPVKVQWSI